MLTEAVSAHNYHRCLCALTAGANPNVISNHPKSALENACFHRNKSIMELLLDKKASVNMSSCLGRTPLFFSQTSETTQLLLERKAFVNHQDIYGRTALSHLCLNNNEVIAILFAHGASAHLKDRENKTLYQRACLAQKHSDNFYEIANVPTLITKETIAIIKSGGEREIQALILARRLLNTGHLIPNITNIVFDYLDNVDLATDTTQKSASCCVIS